MHASIVFDVDWYLLISRSQVKILFQNVIRHQIVLKLLLEHQSVFNIVQDILFPIELACAAEFEDHHLFRLHIIMLAKLAIFLFIWRDISAKLKRRNWGVSSLFILWRSVAWVVSEDLWYDRCFLVKQEELVVLWQRMQPHFLYFFLKYWSWKSKL